MIIEEKIYTLREIEEAKLLPFYSEKIKQLIKGNKIEAVNIGTGPIRPTRGIRGSELIKFLKNM